MKKKLSEILISFFAIIPDFMLSKFERIFAFLKYIIFSSRKKKNIKSIIYFQNENIVLNLKKNDHQAHDVYRSLHKKKDVIYELPLISIVLEILKKENFKNFLDLGAFMGYYSCLIGKIFQKENINIYAIESNPEYCKLIKKNIKDNNLKNVTLINSVLSDKSEELYIDKESVHFNNQGKNLLKIKSKTLDEICSEFSINPEILKFDVHGFEGKVLNGLKKNLTDKVKIILLELHSNSYLEKFSNSNKREIINFLIDNKYKCLIVPYYGELNLYKVSDNFSISSHKIPYRIINKNNYEDLFFDKEHTDNLIIAFKDNIDIEKYSCFLNLEK